MMNTFSQPVVPITAGTNSGGFGGGGDGLWIFALLLLGLGGFGGGDGGRAGGTEVTGYQLGEMSGKVATKDSVQMLTNSIDNQFSQTNQNLFNVREQLGNGLSTVTFELANRINTVASAISSCCCETKQALAEGFGQVRYDLSNFAAQITANDTANTQKVLDALCQDRKERDAMTIASLQRQLDSVGTVKYPLQTTYNAGQAPFCAPQPHGCY